jgi:cobalt-zinc-cadmium efflux system protein
MKPLSDQDNQPLDKPGKATGQTKCDAHGHAHGLGHSHGSNANRPRVLIALCLTGGFMVVEIIGGLLSGSLALLADAAHMLLDTVALLLTWLAFGLAEKPADASRSYGYHRFPILVAFTNGITMLFIVGWIFYEAAVRLFNPTDILATPMLIVASIGLLVNLVAAWVLMGGDRGNLNMRGALVHVMGDLLGSVAAIAAAVIILFSGWNLIDPLLSALVAALILRSAWALIRDAGHILLEGTPTQLDVKQIGRDLEENVDQVEEVHHLHAWSLSQDRLMLTLHARISEHAHADSVLNAIHNRLAERFDIDHATVQIEVNVCADVALVKET